MALLNNNLSIALIATVLLSSTGCGGCSDSRYYMQPAGNGAMYKIDRRTGKTWLIKGGKTTLVEDVNARKEPVAEEALQELPMSELAKIELPKAPDWAKRYSWQAGEDSVSFGVYNGTTWRVRSAVFEVRSVIRQLTDEDLKTPGGWSKVMHAPITAQNESTLWSREFRKDVHWNPLSASEEQITVGDTALKGTEARVKILKAFGVPEE